MGKLKVMIIPVGEQIKPLLYGFRYFTEIDDVILVYSEESKIFAKELEKRLKAMSIVKRIVMVECKAESLPSLLKEISSKIKELYTSKNIELISNITGGTKIMSLSCYILSSLFNGKSFYIFKEDDSMKFVEVPTINSKIIEFLKESEIRVRILQSIGEDGIKLKDLSKIVGRSKATLIYYLNKFHELGLIDKKYDKYVLTELGKFVIALVSE